MIQAIVESLGEVKLPMITTLRQSDLLPDDHHLQQGSWFSVSSTTLVSHTFGEDMILSR